MNKYIKPLILCTEVLPDTFIMLRTAGVTEKIAGGKTGGSAKNGIVLCRFSVFCLALLYNIKTKHLKIKKRMDTLVTRENTNKLYKSSKWPNVLQWLKHYSGQTTTLIKHYENQAASYLLLRNRCCWHCTTNFNDNLLRLCKLRLWGVIHEQRMLTCNISWTWSDKL